MKFIRDIGRLILGLLMLATLIVALAAIRVYDKVKGRVL